MLSYLSISVLSHCRRLGKLLGDVVISQGGVGEYRGGSFYLISNMFMQCPTLHLNFYQSQREKERRKVKRLNRSTMSMFTLFCAIRLVLYCTVSFSFIILN